MNTLLKILITDLIVLLVIVTTFKMIDEVAPHKEKLIKILAIIALVSLFVPFIIAIIALVSLFVPFIIAIIALWK